jgi:hypothetical protein
LCRKTLGDLPTLRYGKAGKPEGRLEAGKGRGVEAAALQIVVMVSRLAAAAEREDADRAAADAARRRHRAARDAAPSLDRALADALDGRRRALDRALDRLRRACRQDERGDQQRRKKRDTHVVSPSMFREDVSAWKTARGA